MQDNFNIHNWRLKIAINELEEKQCPDCGCKMEGTMCNECGYMEEAATFTDKHDDNPKLKGGQKDLPDEVQAKIVAKETVTSPNVQIAFEKITDVLSKISKKMSDNEAYELHEKLKAWFNKLLESKVNEGEDHEVAMAQASLQAIISSAGQLMSKLGDEERNIPGWIQDHIVNAENYIEQANQGFHELDNEYEEN